MFSLVSVHQALHALVLESLATNHFADLLFNLSRLMHHMQAQFAKAKQLYQGTLAAVSEEAKRGEILLRLT